MIGIETLTLYLYAFLMSQLLGFDLRKAVKVSKGCSRHGQLSKLPAQMASRILLA
jgi:hypothetical protein